MLVIDGDRFSGKSYSIRFAVQCAPPDRFVIVDIGEWGETPMTAKDLAHAIDGYKELRISRASIARRKTKRCRVC